MEMSDKENKSLETDTHSSQVNTRRNFLIKSAVAAPIITSLASKPAWAVEQCTVSGMMSGNLSLHDENCGFEGLSPGYWKTHDWPFSSPSKNNYFQDLFTLGAVKNTNDDYGKTLLQVLNGNGGGTNWKSLLGLNFHIVAAACNFAYAEHLNNAYPNGITASFSTATYNSWAEVKAAYEAAIYQFNNETSNGKPVATLAIALEADLSGSYHQFD